MQVWTKSKLVFTETHFAMTTSWMLKKSHNTPLNNNDSPPRCETTQQQVTLVKQQSEIQLFHVQLDESWCSFPNDTIKVLGSEFNNVWCACAAYEERSEEIREFHDVWGETSDVEDILFDSPYLIHTIRENGQLQVNLTRQYFHSEKLYTVPMHPKVCSAYFTYYKRVLLSEGYVVNIAEYVSFIGKDRLTIRCTRAYLRPI